MAAMVAYVAKTHYGKKIHSDTLIVLQQSVEMWYFNYQMYHAIYSKTCTQLTFLLPTIVYELKYFAIPVNWCWAPASCPPMVDTVVDGPKMSQQTGKLETCSSVNTFFDLGTSVWLNHLRLKQVMPLY